MKWSLTEVVVQRFMSMLRHLPVRRDPMGCDEKAESRAHQGQGKILVMDDEQFMLDILAWQLRSMGYECVTAEDGDSALKLAREAIETDQPFAAAILDLTIPGGKGGKEVVQELLKFAPSFKVVAFSGYSEDAVMSNHAAYGFAARLVKPYRVEELAEVLDALLKPPGQGT